MSQKVRKESTVPLSLRLGGFSRGSWHKERGYSLLSPAPRNREALWLSKAASAVHRTDSAWVPEHGHPLCLSPGLLKPAIQGDIVRMSSAGLEGWNSGCGKDGRGNSCRLWVAAKWGKTPISLGISYPVGICPQGRWCRSLSL